MPNSDKIDYNFKLFVKSSGQNDEYFNFFALATKWFSLSLEMLCVE